VTDPVFVIVESPPSLIKPFETEVKAAFLPLPLFQRIWIYGAQTKAGVDNIPFI
jgi:hypothetical protein